MKRSKTEIWISLPRAIALSLFLGLGAFASAHPGPAGHHHHPDEVDEFEQVTAPVEEAPANGRHFLVGGLLAIGATACAGFLLHQRSAQYPAAAAKH